MKVMAYKFSPREKLLLAVLGALLLVLLYIWLVDQRVRVETENAQNKIASLETELATVQEQVELTRQMKAEMESVHGDQRKLSYMPSYNAEKEEVNFLNTTLSAAKDYYIGFSEVSKSGDLVRRNFSLQYTAQNYQSAVDILKSLESSDFRCLVQDLTVASSDQYRAEIQSGPVTVNALATFYETMYEGETDGRLPKQ